MLYPIKLKPRLKEVIWGGDRLAKAGKPVGKNQNPDSIGESWEVSGVEGDESIVENGFLKGNRLPEIIEVYMDELVGDKVFAKFGNEFPLLLKFIDARDRLSVQVHPNDELAAQRSNSRGKTEMWYVVDAQPDAVLYVGFDREISPEEYRAAIEYGTITELLHRYNVKKGDTFFIPAGTLHAIGAGTLIAEIQETSDITYRVSDWGRLDKNGKSRKLHVEESYDAVDFRTGIQYDVTATPQQNKAVELVACEHFTTNLIKVEGSTLRDYAPKDSFVTLMCTEGSVKVSAAGTTETLNQLESILIPAELNDVELTGSGTIIESFIG